MAVEADNREAVANEIKKLRERRFGTKKAAYIAAGVNSGTWDKAEDPEQIESVRADILRTIIVTLAPETHGDWSELVGSASNDHEHGHYVSGPGERVEGGASDSEVLRAIAAMRQDVQAMEQRLSERLDRLEGHGA